MKRIVLQKKHRWFFWQDWKTVGYFHTIEESLEWLQKRNFDLSSYKLRYKDRQDGEPV